jgi:phage-related protein
VAESGDRPTGQDLVERPIAINPHESHNAGMDDRDRQLIQELADAVRKEWLEFHLIICGVSPEENHECLHPKPTVLLKWEGEGQKCAYCGGNVIRKAKKPWTMFCSQKCNAAAWRKRERDKKAAAKLLAAAEIV